MPCPKGFKHPPEYGRNISAKLKGRKQTSAHIAKRAAALRGKKRPRDVVEKIARANRGRVVPPAERAMRSEILLKAWGEGGSRR